MAFQVQQYGIPNKRVLQTSTETVGNVLGGGCMHGKGVFKTRNGEMTKWRNGEMTKWRNGEMAKWRNGEMAK